uniref:Polygalacturonase n=1 Tax=Kalanchoe fedtschenkoi TaxID=63787 RepID=A0A7N0TJK7_KALFE
MLTMCTLITAQIDVTNYGAVGDGETDDSTAFLKAWTTLCDSTEEYPTLVIPEGKTFYVQPLYFQGPCKSSKLRVKIEGDILAPKKEDWKKCGDSWITFSSVNNLIIFGDGKLNGQGASWWGQWRSHWGGQGGVYFNKCKNLQLSGITSVNSSKTHFSLQGCHRANISGLSIEAPETSPDTNGINLSKSSDIVVDNITIGTGNDCISIGGGIKNLTITRIICGPGHGISIGSLGKNKKYETVEDVLIRGCTFSNVQNGARIKTWEGGSGYVKGIRYENITLKSAKRPIIIDQSYCPTHDCEETEVKSLEISNVSFVDFYGTTATLRAITLNCTSDGPGCTDINLDNVTIRRGPRISLDADEVGEHHNEVYAYCRNAHGKATATIPEVPCLEE